MARVSHSSKLGSYFYGFVALSCILSSGECRSITTLNAMELPVHEGTVKTIKGEDGDVIDCVDIYKQPAFDHPLLKNHTIQMKPSSFLNGMKAERSKAETFPTFIRNVNCPEGTIPIIRTPKHNYVSYSGQSTKSIQYAQVSLNGGKYLGAYATISALDPKVADGDYSSAQIWVTSGDTVRSPDGKARPVASWTRDGYNSTGCYNLECPGFVQKNSEFPLGCLTQPVSIYDGQQYAQKIDRMTSNWWLQMKWSRYRYWPASIFTKLANSATDVSWGGEVSTDAYLRMGTEIGSGHFPTEGWGRASVIHTIGVADDGGFLVQPANLTDLAKLVSNPWYDVAVPTDGSTFYYGGPGKQA